MKRILFSIALILLINTLKCQVYNRIISLSPAATFNLIELGCTNKVVGCTSYCDLATNEKLVVGSAISMNTEKVLSLKPDVVIYTPMFKPNEIDRIKSLGIHTELFNPPKNYKETCDQFLRLGKMVGKDMAASHYIDSLNAKMDSVLAKIPKNNKPKIFIEIGAKPLFTAISNTFMNDYIQILGGVNIAANQTAGTINREKVISMNPDVIIIVTMGIVSEQEKSVWESYKGLSATQNKQIFIVDATLACRPTPYNFVNTIIELNNMIYGSNK